jgi:DNA-binding LacI/PurR family transcriptional regulator
MVDVARLAGVSPTTVSFVINNRLEAGIAQETRERVLAAVRELGYRPNRQARNLRQSRTRSLGFFLPEYMLSGSNYFAVAFLQPLLRAADQHGYQIMAFTASGDPLSRYADLVAAGAVDGFILVDSRIEDPRARYLSEAGVPFASFGRTAEDLPQSWVDLDNRASMAQVVDYLVERGHHQIAYAGRPLTAYWWREREEGFRARMLHHGLTVRPTWMLAAADDVITERLTRILTHDDRPTAVVTGGDGIAISAYRACAAAQLAVGTEVAVTGFDPLFWMLNPALTTLSFPVEQVAEALVERCLEELEHGPVHRGGHYFPAHLIHGASA